MGCCAVTVLAGVIWSPHVAQAGAIEDTLEWRVLGSGPVALQRPRTISLRHGDGSATPKRPPSPCVSSVCIGLRQPYSLAAQTDQDLLGAVRKGDTPCDGLCIRDSGVKRAFSVWAVAHFVDGGRRGPCTWDGSGLDGRRQGLVSPLFRDAHHTPLDPDLGG